MSSQTNGARVLVVANRTSSTPTLLEYVAARGRDGAHFTLLIPPENDGDDWTREDAIRLLERAAGGTVDVLDPGPDAVDTIHRAVGDGDADEIIVCAVEHHLSRWVHHDLPRRLEHLGVPVTVIAPEKDAPVPDHVRDRLPDGFSYPPPTPGVEAF
jgi:hypothetical protein